MKLALAALSLGLVVLASDASAQFGKPLTPVSYAGVARSSTHRTAYTEGAGVATTGSATFNTATTLTVLPPGCTEFTKAGVHYKKCGQTYYRPTYQGPNLVYVTAKP
jgi:hypothetical protein